MTISGLNQSCKCLCSVILGLQIFLATSDLFAADKLPIRMLYVPQKIYENSEPISGKVWFPSKSSDYFLIGDNSFRSFFKYSFTDGSFTEFSKYPESHWGLPVVDEIPQNYRYIQCPENMSLLETDIDQFLFHDKFRRSMYAASLTFDKSSQQKVWSSPGNSAFRVMNDHVNGRPVFGLGGGSNPFSIFFLDENYEPQVLVNARTDGAFRDQWRMWLTGYSKYRGAFFDGLQFYIVTAEGANKVTPVTVGVKPSQRSLLRSAFFANEDDMLCLVYRGTRQQPTPRIDYFDANSGEQLGTLSLAEALGNKTTPPEKVVSSRDGKIILLDNLILEVANDELKILADEKSVPRLKCLNERVSYAVSPDSQKIVFDLHPGILNDPEFTERGYAEILVNDIRKVLNQPPVKPSTQPGKMVMTGEPGTQTLNDLDRSQIPIALQRGDEPKELVAIVPYSGTLSGGHIEFSSDNRWLFTGVTLYDVADGDVIDNLTEYAEEKFGYKFLLISKFHFTSDSQRLITVSNREITIWDLSQKDPVLVKVHKLSEIDNSLTSGLSYTNLSMQLPSDNEIKLLIRGSSTTCLLSLSEERLTVLDQKPNDFFVNEGGIVSYSADGKMIYAEALEGAFRGYDISKGVFDVVSILKPTLPNQSRRRLGYSLVASPFTHLYDQGNSTAWTFADGQFSDPIEADIRLDHLYYDMNQNRIEGVDAGKVFRFVVMDQDFKNAQAATLSKSVHRIGNYYDIAGDNQHVAVLKDDRIWIMRCEFKEAPINVAGKEPVKEPVTKRMVPTNGGATSKNAPPTFGQVSEETKNRLMQLSDEYTKRIKNVPEANRIQLFKEVQEISKRYQSKGFTFDPEQKNTIKMMEEMIETVKQYEK